MSVPALAPFSSIAPLYVSSSLVATLKKSSLRWFPLSCYNLCLFQYADILIASSDYSKAKVVLTTDSWDEEIGDVETDDGWMTDEKSQETLWYKYYNGDAEWKMLAFKSGIIY